MVRFSRSELRRGRCFLCAHPIEPDRAISIRPGPGFPNGRKMAHRPGECARPGWIYVIPSLGPSGNLVKIGSTRLPLYRIQEVIAADIWKVAEPQVAWLIAARDRRFSEQSVLSELLPNRAFLENPDRRETRHPYQGWTEMFDVEPSVAVSVAVRLLGNEAASVARVLWSNAGIWSEGGLRAASFASAERLNGQRPSSEARCDGTD